MVQLAEKTRLFQGNGTFPTPIPQTDCSSRDVQMFLEKIVEQPSLHAKFLNTISLLEHMGSRKILVSQSHSRTSESVLQHAAEEARHAYFFKKKIRLVDPSVRLQYQKEDLFQGERSAIYFQRLDALVKRNLSKEPEFDKQKKSRLNYLYTTILIEIRAFDFYHLYNQVLESKFIGFHLNGIIKEEEGHLSEMIASLNLEDPRFESRLEGFLIKEGKFFRNLFRTWKSSIKE
ncbi:MAG: hypothetical protein JJT78_13775 [Leptospira sp.]|nr:hypothetical protein [Leptospira sp.]